MSPASILLDIETNAGTHHELPDGCSRARVRVLAVGNPSEIDSHPRAAGVHRARLDNAVLIPGLVNAHTHLDLTHVGPRPFDPGRGFMGWIDLVRRERASVPDAIRDSVRRGIRASLAGGVVAVGDIAGAPTGLPSIEPYRALADSALAGVSFLEFFAIGRGEDRGRERAAAALASADPANGRSVRLGLQPHAPNTVSLNGYRWAVDRAVEAGLPMATHLAETVEERQFVALGRGPQRSFLEAIGLWDEALGAVVGHGRSPVQHLQPILERARFVLAHVNDASNEDLEVLAGTGQSVVYCPRAADYFEIPSHLGPHRYQEMLDRGINVAVGTDSIINLAPGRCAAGAGGMSPLDDLRFLYMRDWADPNALLRLATVNGAKALGLDPKSFTFNPGVGLAGLVAVDVGEVEGTLRDPAEAALRASTQPRLLLAGNSCCLPRI